MTTIRVFSGFDRSVSAKENSILGSVFIIAIGILAVKVFANPPKDVSPDNLEQLNEHAVIWNQSWGDRFVGRCGKPIPTIIISADSESAFTNHVENELVVFQAMDLPDSISGVSSAYKLLSISLPAESFSTEIKFDNSIVFLDITYDFVALRCTDLTKLAPREHYVWGLQAHGIVSVLDHETSKPVDYVYDSFKMFGETKSAKSAIAAVESAELAINAAATPSCYDQCMAILKPGRVAALESCLSAVGVVGAGGCAACLVGCLGSGPLYPGCVTGCFASVGTAAAVGAAACFIMFTGELTGDSLGCYIGCETCW